MLDRLPPALRHFLIVIGAAFAQGIVSAVISAQGVTGVDWSTVLLDDVNHTAVAGVTAFVALWLTPLTRQYGVGSDAGPVD